MKSIKMNNDVDAKMNVKTIAGIKSNAAKILPENMAVKVLLFACFILIAFLNTAGFSYAFGMSFMDTATSTRVGVIKSGAVNMGSTIECYDSDVAMDEGKLLHVRENWKGKFSTLDEFAIKGKTQGIYAGTGEIKTFTDYCRSNTELVEYSCTEKGKVVFKVVVCPAGCEDGRCKQPPYCIDTDKSNNEYFKGRVWYLSKDEVSLSKKTDAVSESLCGKVGNLYACYAEDYCEGNTLHQFNCVKTGISDSKIKETETECQNACKNGACYFSVLPGTTTHGVIPQSEQEGEDSAESSEEPEGSKREMREFENKQKGKVLPELAVPIGGEAAAGGKRVEVKINQAEQIELYVEVGDSLKDEGSSISVGGEDYKISIESGVVTFSKESQNRGIMPSASADRGSKDSRGESTNVAGSSGTQGYGPYGKSITTQKGEEIAGAQNARQQGSQAESGQQSSGFVGFVKSLFTF